MSRKLARLLLASIFAVWCGSALADPPKSIRIGVLNDASGPYSDNAGTGSVVAARMAADDFMAAHPSVKVEILSADHQNKADIGAGIARKWLDVDKVNAIADVPNSAVALAVNEIVRNSEAVFIASSAATSDLTGTKCSPNTLQWTFDSWAVAHTLSDYLVHHNGKKWYFVATDNALGHSLVRDATPLIEAAGGEIAGDVNLPINSSDYSSALLQAQAANPDVIAFATAGGDTVALIKQSLEFGLHQPGRIFAAMLATINDVHAGGLAAAQGLILSQPFYWNRNEASRAWTKRFAAQVPGRVPTAFQAGVYSSVRAYLDAAAAAGTTDGRQVMKKLEEKPIDDDLFGKVVVRPDGRATHSMFLFRVKSPEESKGEWDLLEEIGSLSGSEAFRPLGQGGCPLVGSKG